MTTEEKIKELLAEVERLKGLYVVQRDVDMTIRKQDKFQMERQYEFMVNALVEQRDEARGLVRRAVAAWQDEEKMFSVMCDLQKAVKIWEGDFK